MSVTIEQLYQDIGREAIAFAEGLSGRLLIYAEVEDGALSADLFYVNSSVGSVRFRFCSKQIQKLILDLWRVWQEYPGNREWRVMCYLIDGGRFSIDLSYSDQINEDEDVSDRRPAAIEKYFGDAKVDYSSP
jgi:hypothetical protein